MSQLIGDDLANVLLGTKGSDGIWGRGGDDLIRGDGGTDTIYGEAGDDTIIQNGQSSSLTWGCSLFGGSGNDMLVSTQTSAWGAYFSPGTGNDTVSGSPDLWALGEGDDLILGDLGDVGGLTVLVAPNGSGTVLSGSGTVKVGFSYIQWFDLSPGADRIEFSNEARWKGCAPGAGSDTILGGDGVDDLWYGVQTGQGIALDVGLGRLIDPWGHVDYFSSVESFRGSQDGDVMTVGTAAMAVKFEGNAGGDTLDGGSLSDTLNGGDGADFLSGWQGNDLLLAGSGNDTLDGGAGNDTLEAGFGLKSAQGGEGIDTLRMTFDGLAPAAVMVFDLAGGVTYAQTQPASARNPLLGLENLDLSGLCSFDIKGNALANVLHSADGADTIKGMEENDTLSGGRGNDILLGGSGADLMLGGAGNDSYQVDNRDDRVTEFNAEGWDTVKSTVNWTLPANVEELSLFGASAVEGYGNAMANRITGSAAANILEGKAGADTLVGGAGHDTYFADALDTIIESASGGRDHVLCAASFTLDLGVENLTLIGAAPADGIGNSIDNRLTGNAAANLLSAGGGSDTLMGGEGCDTLVGGKDADTFVFRQVSESPLGTDPDTINDFVQGLDLLDLQGIDAKPERPRDQAFDFTFETPAAHAVWYDARRFGVVVYADVDGDGAADFHVVLRGLQTVSLADFLL